MSDAVVVFHIRRKM